MKKAKMFLAGIVTMLGLPIMVQAAPVPVDSSEALENAINEATDGTVIQLTGSFEVTNTITVDDSVTIDLNGNTITGAVDRYVFDFNGTDSSKKFAITDSSSTPGTITNTVRGVLVTNGTLTIDSVTISSADRAIQINPLATDDVAKVIMNGGTVQSNGSRTIMLWGNNVKGATSLEVNDGNIIAPISVKNSAAINLGSDNAAGNQVTINGGNISGYNGIRLYGNGEEGMTVLTMNDGNVTAVGSGIIQSTTDGTENTTIAIYGGTITAADQDGQAEVGGDAVAINHSQFGTLIIGKADGTGPTLIGETGVAIKEGIVSINGGKITGNGVYREVPLARNDGTEDTGAAVSITSNDEYPDGTTIVIAGGILESVNGNAFYEGIAEDEDGNKAAATSYVNDLSIVGGNFIGATDKASVLASTYEGTGFISGGTFSSDVSEYVNEDVVLGQDGNGNYVVGDPVSDVPTDTTEAVENPETSDGILTYVIIAVIGTLGIAGTTFWLKLRKTN